MRIVVLAGGIGGARFLTGVRATGEQVTAIVNTGDDVTLHGLRICPDLDSVMYTLGGGSDQERGWGRAGETWVVKDELAAYGAEPAWFGLGDKDVATPGTHPDARRRVPALGGDRGPVCSLAAGCAATPRHRRPPGDPRRHRGDAIHFQEWWVRYHAEVAAERFVFVGADAAKPAAGVLDALAEADLVLVAPSNPVVSIAPILAVAGLREALVNGRPGLSGCHRSSTGHRYGGWPTSAWRHRRAVHGGRCRRALRRPVNRRVLDGWLVDTTDADTTVADVPVRSCPLWMRDEKATVAMVETAIELAEAS